MNKPNSGYLTEGKLRGTCALCDSNSIVAKSLYKVGEVVAVAQAYEDTPASGDFFEDAAFWKKYKETKGWRNKMFVRAYRMPHHIRITNVRIEKLQDISDEDCMREGIWEEDSGVSITVSGCEYAYPCFRFEGSDMFASPREAFAALIDKVSGKGTWESNPYCFCYEFELIK